MMGCVWLLPASRFKNSLLRSLGHAIDPTARAFSCLVLRVSHFEMAEESVLRRWNIIKDVERLAFGKQSSMGVNNRISSHRVYKSTLPGGATLILEDHAKVTSHHFIDCAGGVRISSFASLAGRESTILTHAVDLRRNAQTAYPIVIGPRSFVSARVVILGGAALPERSILAAGAVLTASRTEREPGLWGGVPARRVGDADGAWFDRTATHTRNIYVPETDELIENAF